MARIIYLFPAFLMLLCCKSTQEVVKVDEEPIFTVQNFQEGIFFKIEKQGLEPSFLLGTINTIDHENYIWSAELESKVVDADRIVLGRSTQYENLEQLSEVSLLPASTTMRDYISEDEYQYFLKFMEDSMEVSHRVFEELYARLKPVFLEQLAVVHYIGANPESYDNNISLLAENHNIELIGLESLAEQIIFYDQIPLENQYAELITTITSGKKGEEIYHNTIAAYKSKDLVKLEELLSGDFKELPNYQELMKERRMSWMPKLKEVMSKGNTFIAVGIGHLLGDYGLLELIQREGYSIESINIE